MSFREERTRWQIIPGRRLVFEALERRDLLAVMRIVNWNTLNGPNDATGDAHFQTIFQAIGEETVQGNTQRINILALQETDPPGAGGNSIGRIETILDALYPSTDYASVVSPVDGGGDSTGFVYDTSSVSLLESLQIGAGSLTHTILRGKFRPAATMGTSDFYIYSIHLKSGTTLADATTRGNEAALLRADADSLGEGTHVLFVGDFNMQGSSEAAFVNFVGAGAGQLQDVADAPGNWNDNPAFKSLHSQNPQAAMDDRFDIQFATGEFFDGVGLEYVSNSYHVFANNGTHTIDQPITTGTGASPAVLNALVAVSDHLPVVADYQIIVSMPNVRISETLGSTKVVEGGLYDTYQVVLDTVPSANVTVTVTPDAQVDLGSGSGVAVGLTFTPANALTPQTVVVRAADDAVGEGNHTGLITHMSASADAAYNGLSIASVTVAIVDNDAPTIVINEIDADQVGTDMMEFVELYDGGVGNFSLAGYVVVFFNGNAANNDSYATLDLAGMQTNADGFFVLGNSGVTPAPGLVFNNNTLQNGADAVALYFGVAASSIPNGTSPTAAVLAGKLRDAIVYDTDDPDDVDLIAALTPGKPQVNENQNGSGTTQSLARVPDGGPPYETTLYVAQAPTPGTFNKTPTRGVLIIQSAGRVDVEEGGASDSYQLALLSIPTANVQITVDPDGQTDLGAGAGAPIVLTFTPANALIPQTVTVFAVDDAMVEGVHTSIITHSSSSADANYNGLVISNVVANIVDNDLPPPTSIVISEIMYNPASDEISPGVGEWIEIVNTGLAATDLSGWLFDDEDATNWGPIPGGTILNPGQVAVFFDATFTTAATFRAEWNVPAGALVVGIPWGSLSNSPSPTNEILQLLNSVGIQMDVVNYDDASPWPSAADGPSIYLKNLPLDNNVGANWARSTAAVKAWSPTAGTFSASDVGSPGWVFLAADYHRDQVVDGGDYVLWRKTLGSTTSLFADGSGPTNGVPNGIVDQADYNYWRSNFGSVLALSGSGSGSGASVSAEGMNSSAPERASPAAAEAAADTAIVDLSFLALRPAGTAASKQVMRSTQPDVSADAADHLLLAIHPAFRTRPLDESPGNDAGADVAADNSADDFFALLDEAALQLAL